MSFSIGIVGLPNVGKSTLFRALTKKQVDASNYPFCTIDPNVGVVKVPDERVDKLAEISDSQQIIHTVIEFVDIAGLVKGAHKGEGLGNQFLANIREVDAILQVVRGFQDDDIIHVHNKIDPSEDIEVINSELILADLSVIEKRIQSMQKGLKSGGDKLLKKQLEVYEKIKTYLEKGELVNKIEFEPDEEDIVKELNFLTNKPFLYIINVDEDKMGTKSKISGIDKDFIIPISAKIESEIAELAPNDAKAFLEDLNLEKSGLDQVISASYKLLNLISYFTSGEKETRAWTIEKGTKAPQAAGKIHTDFEKGFIRAEVTKYEDFIKHNGEQGAKEAGVMAIEGKEYVVQDGDVMHFRFN